METHSLEWDTRLQLAYNREAMAGCDEDVIDKQTEELEDSEEYEMFYDWLIKLYKEVTESNAKMPPYFMRYVLLQTRDGVIVNKKSFVNFSTNLWTYSVTEEGKGSFVRQKSRQCEHTVT